jgi:hypothetical protein
MTLNDLPPVFQAAFNIGDIEVKVIAVSTDDFEAKLTDALNKGWACVAISTEAGRTQGMLIRSTENKTEE